MSAKYGTSTVVAVPSPTRTECSASIRRPETDLTRERPIAVDLKSDARQGRGVQELDQRGLAFSQPLVRSRGENDRPGSPTHRDELRSVFGFAQQLAEARLGLIQPSVAHHISSGLRSY